MGHIRLGRLPKTRNWSQVFDLLDKKTSDVSDIATSILIAARKAFYHFESDPGLNYCYWLLTRVTWHARSESFEEKLIDNLGLDISDGKSSLDVVSKISEHAAEQIKAMGKPTIFTNIAQLSMRETLTQVIGKETNTLFGASPEDVHLAFRRLAARKQFGLLSRQFFANFLTRTVQFFVSKEISNHVGPGKKFLNIEEVRAFDKALDTYCYQSAKIVEQFAGGWYSKRNWQGDITKDDARKFVHVALKKISEELALEGEGQ